MQAREPVGYGGDLRLIADIPRSAIQIALPLDAIGSLSLRETSSPISERSPWERNGDRQRQIVPKFTPITPGYFEEGDRVSVVNSPIKEEIGRQGRVGKPTQEVKNRVRVLLDGDCLYRLFSPECLVKLPGTVTPITSALDWLAQIPISTGPAKSVMGVEARLAQLEAERSRILSEGAIAQKGVWIEGFTTVRQRKSGKRVRYEYFHLCTWNPKEKCEQKRHLGSAKDSRYLQAKEAIWRRDRLEAIDKEMEMLKP